MTPITEKIEYLVRQAVRLPIEARRKVAERILAAKPDAESRASALLAMAEDATGRKVDGTRIYVSTMMRRFVAYRMVGEGYGVMEIGRALGRDHSTVTHYVRRMEDCFELPAAFAYDMKMYKLFNEKADENDIPKAEAPALETEE